MDVFAMMESFAAVGLRVLALASKPLKEAIKPKSDPNRYDLENDLIFQGLIGLYDPPRPESALSARSCQEAGISVHVSGPFLQTYNELLI